MSGAATPVDDNPSWGGPEPNRHDLEYLLRVLGSTEECPVADGCASRGCASSSGDNIHVVPPSPNQLALSSAEEEQALTRRIHEKLIIHQDENYIAIHKPADLRMDGPFGATVHKLLLYLFPPPSLLEMASGRGEMTPREDGKYNEHERVTNHQLLLKAIAPLSKHSFLKDDPHRMAHQLDYATSGVLLIGKNKKATGVACRSFEERKTNKQYVAVVINPASSASNDPPLGTEFLDRLPMLPPSSLGAWEDGSLEKRYRKKRQRDMDEREGKRGTFDGYMPIHSVFDKWRASLVREKKEREARQQQNDEQLNAEQLAAMERRKAKRKKRKIELPALPSPKTALTSGEIDELLSLPASWKAVKSHCTANGAAANWTSIVETMTKEYNQSLAEFYAEKFVGQGESKVDGGNEKGRTPSAAAKLPPLFRIQNNSNKDSKENGNASRCDNKEEFYICASIGEPKDGRFSVIVDPSAACEVSIDSTPTPSPLPELRPALTKCTVQWRGHIDAPAADARIAVAKVLLQPCTGRRHQLRVHMAHVAGCPILGDATYGGNLNVGEDSNEHRAVCRRMCLHAKQLTIPLIGGETKTFVAPDPFMTRKKEDCDDESLIIL